VLLADYWQDALLASATTWNLHTTQQKDVAPTNSEVVNLTGFTEHKGLNVSRGKMMIVCSGIKENSLLAVSK
jgi:hypothetical protein